MKFNIIGAGRLGKNIALSLSTTQPTSSLSICNRSLESAHKACQDIGSGLAVDTIKHLPKADVTWISSNDDAIPCIVETLAQHSLLNPGSFVIHCSGVLNSTLLAPLQAQGCSVASFHPLKAFKAGYLDAAAFNKVDCVLEGDKEVCDWLRHSFTDLGAHITTIKPENKAKYHAAASIASNYLITLASCGEELFLKAGLDQQQSRTMLINLMQGNLTNLHQTEQIADALTGPLARGDIKTLALHLQSIESVAVRNLYKTVGLCTLPLTQLAPEQKQKIEELFTE